MEDKIVDLVSKLEQVSKFVWENAVQQSVVMGYYYAVKEVAFLISLVFFVSSLIWIARNRLEDDTDGGWVALFIILLGLSAVSLIGMVVISDDLLTYLLNPEWGAILILRDLVQ